MKQKVVFFRYCFALVLILLTTTRSRNLGPGLNGPVFPIWYSRDKSGSER